MPMQSRTDQVHSYQFFLQRVVSGLVTKESDPADLPFRRLGWSGFGSVMLAVVVAAGFGIYGILVGGGATSWQDGRSVIVEKETGTPYIFRDQRLYPMVNFVSARLALPAGAGVVRVSARSLAGVPRGPALGIPGAPPGLPSSGKLLTGGWTLCSEAVPDGRGGRSERSVLAVGQPAPGGELVAEDQAVLVRDAAAAGSELHLVWHGHRFALAATEPVRTALGFTRERALPVAPAWLDALPVGEPISPPAAGERGEPTAALGDLREDRAIRTGQVLAAGGAYYLVREAELREVTPLQRDLLLSDPDTAAAYPEATPDVVEVPTALIANAVIDPRPGRRTTSPPETRPELHPFVAEDLRDGAVCAAYQPGVPTPVIVAGARLPGAAGGVPSPGVSARGGLLVDVVLVAGGAAALVQAAPSPELAGGTLHLVTDQGFRYGLPGLEVAAGLGYDPGRLVRLPAGLVARLPAGPMLDPAAALRPVPPAGPA
jgi:type VII secretion protein EccB